MKNSYGGLPQPMDEDRQGQTRHAHADREQRVLRKEPVRRPADGRGGEQFLRQIPCGQQRRDLGKIHKLRGMDTSYTNGILYKKYREKKQQNKPLTAQKKQKVVVPCSIMFYCIDFIRFCDRCHVRLGTAKSSQWKDLNLSFGA